MPKADSLTSIENLSTALATLTASAAANLVGVHAHRARASGFIWRPGLIVTAEDALPEEGEFTVTLPGGDTVAAQLVGRDASTDVALLRIDRADLPGVSLASPALAAGALAIALGAEDGTPTAALGVVSRAGGAWRSLRGGEIDARIELDLRLRRSAQGGLAFDATGRAIGMTVLGPRRRTLVIPSATIERVAAKLSSHGRVPRGYLGLGLQPVAVTGGAGAMIISVDAQGPGAAAGIFQGDIIVAWNGEPIRHLQTIMRALGPDSVGQTVTLGLHRAGETKQVSLKIAERPAA